MKLSTSQFSTLVSAIKFRSTAPIRVSVRSDENNYSLFFGGEKEEITITENFETSALITMQTTMADMDQLSHMPIHALLAKVGKIVS